MKAGIDIYSSQGTLEATGLVCKRRAKSIPPYAGITNKNFDMYAFPIEHDATEPFGYLVRETRANEYLFFCPDSGFIKQRFALKFTIIAIECSYDRDIIRKRVKDGKIHEEVAKRIVRSHAEKDTTLKYLRDFCDLSRCREIHLLHCSSGNLDKEKTKAEFKKKLFIEPIIK
jgi:phosphoribosyl 1,2-cyclic phosphodiesterase